MIEFFKRLFSRPVVAFELTASSLFINILALASPLFVMQVLNRYVAQGVDATLVTLTSGVLIAIVLEFAFRQARLSLARGVSAKPDARAATGAFDTLTRARTIDADEIPPDTRREIVSGSAVVECADCATNITAILDVPFSFVFIFVLYLIEPLIAFIVLGFLVLVFVVGIIGGWSQQKMTSDLNNASAAGSPLLSTVTREGDTVRSFNAGLFLRQAWRKHTLDIQKMRRDIASRQGLVQTVTQSSNGLMSVSVISVGAVLVVMGEMDVGAMIGGNILGARALQPIAKFSQMGAAFAKARQALAMFRKLSEIPLEPESGAEKKAYEGAIELRDVAFTFPGGTTPLFESLSVKLDAGAIMVVSGANGTGKTTLARLVMGLLDPTRGQVLVDGIDLKQIAPEWWRRQVTFLPQEPGLLNATIAENLLITNPHLDSERIEEIIDACGLRQFIDESPKGLETVVNDNGWRLSEGIRRRIALGRALATDGRLILVDEPTESLDDGGRAAIHAILRGFAQQGRTIIVVSHDRGIVKGNHTLVDLDVKPVPGIESVAAPPAPAPQAARQPAKGTDIRVVEEMPAMRRRVRSVVTARSGS